MKLSGCIVIESADDDRFNAEEFNETLRIKNRGFVVCRKKIIHEKNNLPNNFLASKSIDIDGDESAKVHDDLPREITQLMQSLSDNIIYLRKRVDVTARLSILCHDNIQFYDYEIIEREIIEKNLILSKDESNENYRHLKPYARGGFWLDEKTIQLMEDIGAQLDLDECFDVR